MTLELIYLLLAALMVPGSKAPLALAMNREKGGYDNRNPRAQQARLSGYGARALAAHQNMVEAFPLFAAGLLAALWAGADGAWLHGLALAFLIARVAYTLLYLADRALLRSLVWSVGFGASIGLMIAAVVAA